AVAASVGPMTWEDFVLDQLMMERQYPAAKKRFAPSRCFEGSGHGGSSEMMHSLSIASGSAAGLTSWLQLAFGDQGSPGTNFAAVISLGLLSAFNGSKKARVCDKIVTNMLEEQIDLTGAMGNSEQMSPEEAEKLAERQAEIAEALAEEKRKRDEKHRKMESEREEMRQGIRTRGFGTRWAEREEMRQGFGTSEAEREEMRQGIRDKYNIQKKEEFNPMPDGEDVAGRLGRKRKTPEELAAERDLEDQEDFASFLPEGVRDTVKSVTAVRRR
uniref:MFAP1 domain-containing protein n=1 Tax=Macrostomum lignano TaxID=282301 RepID=A0A1I8JNU5_9PLAT